MDPLIRFGRCFFAAGIIAFGVQYLIHGQYLGGLPPVPPWAPGGRVEAYAMGVFLIACGLSIAVHLYTRASALAIAVVFLLCVVILHTPHLHDIIYNGTDRTRALEPLALAAAALVLAGISKAVTVGGRVLFALTMLVFGAQHFMYARFIAFLIPAWMPAHLFLAYFTGTAFVVAGLAILSGYGARLGATWLGIMFLLWVIVLHTPRAVAIHKEAEWTSLFVALAMGGASWIVAQATA